MKDYPNEEALRKAHRIYLDAMRGFIHRCLKKVQGTTPTELIMRALDCELSGDIEVKIEVNNIPYLIREYWGNCFHREFDRHYDARSAAGLIKDGRNFWAHPGIEDVDSESTRMHLSLVAEALGEINKPEAKEAVETIRDQLFSDEPEEHPLEAENAALKENLADITKQLEAAKAEKTELEKQVKTTSDRLEEVEAEWIACDKRLTTMSTRLTMAVAEKTTAEERLSDISNRLQDTEVEKTELEKRLKTMSDRLKDVEVENAAYKKRISELSKASTRKVSKPKPTAREKFRAKNTLEDRKEIGRQVAELRINSAGSKSMSWKQIREELDLKNDEFHKVIRLEDHYQESVVERIESFEDGWEYKGKLEVLLGFKPVGELANRIEACKPASKVEAQGRTAVEQPPEHLPPNTDPPDSITFQGTTFTRRLNKYHVTEVDISQNFWHYWHSQGREGKQEMRDAGWNVEKVNGDWEVTISPVDFQAWIEGEVTELNGLLDFSRDKEPSIQPIRPSHERTSLPTVKEMVQPALEVFADRKEHRRVEMINHLTEHFLLSDNQRSYLSKTGQAEKHLMNKGLIERTRAGYYRITTLGLISSGTNS